MFGLKFPERPKKNIFIGFGLLTFALFSFFLQLNWAASRQNFLPAEEQARVEKVLKAIEMLEKAQLEKGQRPLSSIILTENELNAYIAYRIKTDPLELLRELQLKLLDDNRFEGKAVFDLSQEKLPDFVPKEALLFFSASFKIDGGKIFFSFQQIFLGTQKLPVDFVSQMIKAIALAHNAPPEGLNRSYDLPYGIRDVKSKKGIAIFYY